MLIKRPLDIKSSEITDEAVYQQRRDFIRDSGKIAIASTIAAALPSTAIWAADPRRPIDTSRFSQVPKSKLSDKNEELTSYKDATSYNNFYELGTRKTHPKLNSAQLITHPWSVKVAGECNKPGIYHLEDLIDYNQLEERVFRFRCVEAWSMVVPWVGLPLSGLLKRFEPNSKARFVQFETIYDTEMLPAQKIKTIEWPYREGLRMDEAMHPLTTLAVGLYGKVLPNQNGAPLRLIIPWKYGFKSIKSIVTIRFTETEPHASWNQLQPGEYGFYANVNPEVSHPRWSQKRERRLGEWTKRPTLPFNGYGDQVASLYKGMDLTKFY